MDFGEAVDKVITRVKRPDKIDSAQDKINEAISLFVVRNWAADLVELTHALSAPTSYIHAIDITASPFERFRKIKYIRPTGYTKYLTWRDPAKIFQENCEEINVWYRGGNYVRSKISSLVSTFEIGYYQYHEILTENDDTDWMLDQIWPAINAYVLGELFGEIGEDTDARAYTARWPVLLNAFHNDIGDGISNG